MHRIKLTSSQIVEPEAVIMASAREQVLPLDSDHTAMAAPDNAMLESPAKQYKLIAELVADLASGMNTPSTTKRLC